MKLRTRKLIAVQVAFRGADSGMLLHVKTVHGRRTLEEVSNYPLMTSSLVTDHPLANGCPPRWASQWGEDEYGPWCGFEIGQARQMLRWIPPGQFLMGSPNDEEGRFDNEGPQHWVTISYGFWLFDTPCTQSLWKAVTGKTPSQFKGPSRPVEQVSWHDCQDFMKRLNELVPRLKLRLPTEAEWEYSTRAGKGDALYGNLDDIAWYGDNSKSKTHDVKGKQANDWGLYDLLGNVWEWCEDDWGREYTDKSQTDPLHVVEAGAHRVIRGGGRGSPPQYVRAACRSADPSEDRSVLLGVRCLSSSELSQ